MAWSAEYETLAGREYIKQKAENEARSFENYIREFENYIQERSCEFCVNGEKCFGYCDAELCDNYEDAR